MLITLSPIPPFDFPAILKRPASRPARSMIVSLEEHSVVFAIQIGGNPVPIGIKSGGTVDQPMLKVEMPDGLSDSVYEEALKRVEFIFSTSLDMTPVYSHYENVSEIHILMQRFRGLKPIRDASLFESMIRVIIGQQLNQAFAATLVNRLMNHAGTTVCFQGNQIQVFPGAEEIAALNYDELKVLSFSSRKAEYIIDFARAVVDGRVDLERLHDYPDDEIYNVLTPLRGIGRWTVECLLLFGYGRPDILPAGDIGVRNAIRNVWQMDAQPTEMVVREMAHEWAPWRSYVTYYLWQSLIP